MTSFEISLDRYLTESPYDEPSYIYCENVIDRFSEDFYKLNENWIEKSKQCDNWFYNLWCRGYNPKKAAEIIERAFTVCRIGDTAKELV